MHYCEELNCFEYKLNDIPVCHDHLVQCALERSSLLLYMFPKDAIRCILDCFDPDEVYYFVNEWNWIAPYHCAQFAAANGLLDLFEFVTAKHENYLLMDFKSRVNSGAPYRWDVQKILKLVISNKDLDMLKYMDSKTWHLTIKRALIEYGEEWSQLNQLNKESTKIEEV